MLLGSPFSRESFPDGGKLVGELSSGALFLFITLLADLKTLYAYADTKNVPCLVAEALRVVL